MLLNYKSLHDGLNQAEINALYSILRKETIFTETLLMGTTGKYGVYNIVDTGIQVVNAIPTGQYTFNFSDGTVGVGVANDEGIVDVDISFDRSSVCDVVITFPQYVVRINYNLSLSGDKSIIQKNESVIVTALLTMDGTFVSGETLNYQIKHGSTVIDSGTETTDINGEASITYAGTGVGDVDIVVSYGTLLQETFVIQDAILYRSGEVILADYSLTLPQNYQINVKTIKTSSSNSIGTVNVWNNENKALGFGSFRTNRYSYGLEYYNGIEWTYENQFSLDYNVEYDWLYKYENGVASITVNGITKTLSRPHSVVKIDVGLSNSPNMKFKDLIIKAL